MKNGRNVAECLLVACAGLHLPRSFALLYVLSFLVLLRPSSSGNWGSTFGLIWRNWWVSLLSLLLFSVAYGAGMVAWGFWAWPADRLDLINALLLPSLMLIAGLRASEFGWPWAFRLFFSYTLGALVYVLAALVVSGDHWWHFGVVFPQELTMPWGASSVMNVRSVEQNAMPALVLAVPSLLLLGVRDSIGSRWRGAAGLVLAALGGYAVWALDGRLGWLVLLASVAPVLLTFLRRSLALIQLGRWRKRIALLWIAGVALIAIKLSRLSGNHASSIGWSQGLCDERLSLHGSIVRHALEAPWGGQKLRVPYVLCDGAPALLAQAGGTVKLAHNVILDVFLAVGLLPASLLFLTVAPMFWATVVGFVRSWQSSDWDWRIGVGWGWFVFLVIEWSFQPLLFADGVLFYFSFLVIGMLAAGGFFRNMPRCGLPSTLKVPSALSPL